MDKIKKHDGRGFTLVELLTVLAIITMLIGLMVPSLNMARRFAKETKQKAQLATIGAALTVFRGDYGDYPPSDTAGGYCGAMKLCEAMLGWDLMGFDPETVWDAAGTAYTNDPPVSLDRRKGRYLELATVDAFRLAGREGVFKDSRGLNPDAFVLTDVFRHKKRNINAGAPVLYYRADAAGQAIDEIYNYNDNKAIIRAKDMDDDGDLGDHPLADPSGKVFYGVPPDRVGYIQDPKVTARAWPYRPDSYLLITAGADGLYGTSDDIRNFGN